MRNQGQILLIGVMIVLLLLISVPAIIFINQMGTKHGVQSQKRLKGRALADEGIAYAIQQITSQGNTNVNLNTNAVENPATGGLACPALTNGTGYILQCTPGPQPYELTLVAVPKDTTLNSANPPTIAGSSVQAVVSRRTVGVKLPSGYAASAALHLGLFPAVAGDFRVHWGPISLWDQTIPSPSPGSYWTLFDGSAVGMNAYQYPRKFALQGITGGLGAPALGTTDHIGATLTRCSTLPCTSTTDQAEYWTYTNLGIQPTIDVATYLTLAQKSSGITTSPTCSGGGPIQGSSCIGGTPGRTDCGYYNFAGCGSDIAVFDGTFVAPTNAVIYLDNGGAQFNTGFSLDLKQGAFIVTGNPVSATAGNLTVTGVGLNTTGTPQTDIQEPLTAANEYPYISPTSSIFPITNFIPVCTTSLNQCKCQDLPSNPANCALPFRGFLYVQGNMTMPVGGSSIFQMSGVARIDQTLTVNAPNSFVVYYDDNINHAILTTNFELQIDSTTAVP